MDRMFTARAMTALTTDVPLGDLFGVNVVSNRMATVAGGASRALHVVGRIILCPPISARFYEVFTPHMVFYFPLHRQRVIIVADLCEVTLLPEAAINESYLLTGKFRDVVSRKIGNNGVRMLVKVTDNIRHWGLLPTIVNILVTLRAGLRTNIMRCADRSLFGLFGFCERLQATNKDHQLPNVI